MLKNSNLNSSPYFFDVCKVVNKFRGSEKRELVNFVCMSEQFVSYNVVGYPVANRFSNFISFEMRIKKNRFFYLFRFEHVHWVRHTSRPILMGMDFHVDRL